MTGIENFAAFVAAAALFTVTPGIDTAFVLNRSLAGGRRVGAVSTLGICTGVLFHTAVASAGLSALLARSAAAFLAVKYLGAAYLVWLGLSRLARARRGGLAGSVPALGAPAPLWRHYASGVLTNVLNPKVGLFFLAFFPQFVDPSGLGGALPFALLGLTYAAMGLAWLLVLAALAGAASGALRRSERLGLWLERGSGLAFVGMGASVAVSRA